MNGKHLQKVIPQELAMGPFDFKIFTNDMFLILESCEDYNYADDSTPSDEHDTHKESLECDDEHTTQWFDCNGMKANPEKYQGITFGTKPDSPTSFNVKVLTLM